MCKSNSKGIYGGIHKSEVQYHIQPVEYNEPEEGSDYLNGNMNDRNSLCISVYPDGRKNGGHTGTDICTHYKGYCHTIGNLSRKRKGLDHTDGSRRALDDSCNNGSYKYSKEGIIKCRKNRLELGTVGKRRHGIRHHGHTGHKHRKSKENRSQIFFLLRA